MVDHGLPGRAGLAEANAAMSSATDELALQYTAVAADGNRSQQEREAAMLFSLAEQKLDNHDSWEECENAAKEALALFEATGNREGRSDALRLVLHAARSRAAALRSTPGAKRDDVHNVLSEASDTARREADAFRADGYKRGEAAMRLAYAEINQDRRGSKKRAEALQEASTARSLAQEIGDKKLEAHATFCLCFLHQKMRERKRAVELAEECRRLYREMTDVKNEAKALHILGVTRVQFELFDEGVAAGIEALNLFRQMGDQKNEAFENYVIAQYYIIRNLPQQALQVALESLSLFKQDQEDQGWIAQAYGCVAQCLEMSGNYREALRYAEECVTFYSERKNARGEAMSLSMLSRAHLSCNNTREALNAAEDALGAAEAMHDTRWEAHMMRELAQVHMALKNYTEATKVAQQSAALMQGLQDKLEEGLFLNTVTEIAIEQNDWDTLQHTVNEQRALFQQSGDRSREATCLLTSAGCIAGDRFEEALDMAKEALEIYRGINDVRGCARAHKVFAGLHKMKGDYESALGAAEDMRSQLQLTGDKAAEASAVTLLARIQQARDNTPAAVKLANEAQLLCKRSGDRHAECNAWILVSSTLCEHFLQDGHATMEKKRTKALKPAQEALSMARKLNSSHLIAHALYQVGTVHMLTARIGDAMQAANEARSIFYKAGEKGNEAGVVMLMAETQYAAGKEDTAIERCEEVMRMCNECGDKDLAAKAQKLIDKIRPAAPPQGQWVMQAPMSVAAAAPTTAQAADAPESAVAAPTEQKGLDPAVVNATVMEVALTITGSDVIETDAALMDSGLDSLSALSFRQTLQQQVGVKLPSSFVFDYPTVREVTDRIVELSLE